MDYLQRFAIPLGIAFFLVGGMVVFLILNQGDNVDIRWRCDQRNLVYLEADGDVTAVSPQDPRCQ